MDSEAFEVLCCMKCDLKYKLLPIKSDYDPPIICDTSWESWQAGELKITRRMNEEGADGLVEFGLLVKHDTWNGYLLSSVSYKFIKLKLFN